MNRPTKTLEPIMQRNSFNWYTVRAEGSADHVLPSYAMAVRVALHAASSVSGRTVDIINGAGVVTDSWRGSFDALGVLSVRSIPGRVGMPMNVEAEISALLGVAS